MSKLEAVALSYRNLARSISLPPIVRAEFSGLTMRALRASDIEAVKSLYCRLEGEDMGLFSKLVLRLSGGRLCLVACAGGTLIGVDHFYFNHRDFADGTIHEGYVAVDPAYHGRGIATAMRKHCIEHFGASGIRGVSTRVSEENAASMTSAANAGFVSRERYTDNSGQVRHYMVAAT